MLAPGRPLYGRGIRTLPGESGGTVALGWMGKVSSGACLFYAKIVVDFGSETTKNGHTQSPPLHPFGAESEAGDLGHWSSKGNMPSTKGNMPSTHVRGLSLLSRDVSFHSITPGSETARGESQQSPLSSRRGHEAGIDLGRRSIHLKIALVPKRLSNSCARNLSTLGHEVQNTEINSKHTEISSKQSIRSFVNRTRTRHPVLYTHGKCRISIVTNTWSHTTVTWTVLCEMDKIEPNSHHKLQTSERRSRGKTLQVNTRSTPIRVDLTILSRLNDSTFLIGQSNADSIVPASIGTTDHIIDNNRHLNLLMGNRTNYTTQNPLTTSHINKLIFNVYAETKNTNGKTLIRSHGAGTIKILQRYTQQPAPLLSAAQMHYYLSPPPVTSQLIGTEKSCAENSSTCPQGG